MSPSASLLLVILAAIAAVAVARFSLNREMQRLDLLAKWSNKYAQAAHKLLDRPDLPVTAKKRIAFWNRCVGDKDVALQFAQVIHRRRLNEHPEQPDRSAAMYEFFAKDATGAELYVEVTIAALMTISYRSRLWGFVIRAGLTEMIAEHQPKPADRLTNRAAQVVRPSAPALPQAA